MNLQFVQSILMMRQFDLIKQWRNFYLKEQSQLPLTKLNISDEYMFSYISSNDKIEPLHADTLITY